MSNQFASAGTVVRAPKTAELIADQIRGQIVRGELAAGAALPAEVALTVHFGVSRPTLREAFRILEVESLLEVRRGARGGARVLAPKAAVATRHVGVLLQLRHTSMSDLHAARAAIEPPCAGVVARHGTRQDIDAVGDLAARVADVVAADAWTWSTAVGAFRRELLARGSSPATALLGGLIVDLDRTQGAEDSTPARVRATASACVALADLISRRKGAEAVRCWREHLFDVGPSDVPLDSLLA